MLKYPDTIDLECVTTIIDIVKNRTLQVRAQEFCKCAWNVAGYLLKISIGEPGVVTAAGFYGHSGELQDSFEELENCLTNYDKSEQTFSSSSEKEAGDVGTILLVVSVLLQLLRTLGFVRKDDVDSDDLEEDLDEV